MNDVFKLRVFFLFNKIYMIAVPNFMLSFHFFEYFSEAQELKKIRYIIVLKMKLRIKSLMDSLYEFRP